MTDVKSKKEFAQLVSKAVMELIGEEESSPERWPRYMSTKTAALYLDKSERCIRNWVRQGLIETVELVTHGGAKKPLWVDRWRLDDMMKPAMPN